MLEFVAKQLLITSVLSRSSVRRTAPCAQSFWAVSREKKGYSGAERGHVLRLSCPGAALLLRCSCRA